MSPKRLAEIREIIRAHAGRTKGRDWHLIYGARELLDHLTAERDAAKGQSELVQPHNRPVRDAAAMERDRVTVRQMTDDELRDEIAQLLARVGMTSAQLRAKGEAFELDAVERNILADVEAMEWMLSLSS